MLIEINNPIEFKELEEYLLSNGYIERTLDWYEVDKNTVNKFKTPFIDYESNLVKYISRNNQGIVLLNREGTIIYAKDVTYEDLLIRLKNFNDHKDKIQFKVNTHEELVEHIHKSIIKGKTPCPISLVENIRDVNNEYIRLTIKNPELHSIIHSWLQRIANRKLAYGPYPLSFFIP